MLQQCYRILVDILFMGNICHLLLAKCTLMSALLCWRLFSLQVWEFSFCWITDYILIIMNFETDLTSINAALMQLLLSPSIVMRKGRHLSGGKTSIHLFFSWFLGKSAILQSSTRSVGVTMFSVCKYKNSKTTLPGYFVKKLLILRFYYGKKQFSICTIKQMCFLASLSLYSDRFKIW